MTSDMATVKLVPESRNFFVEDLTEGLEVTGELIDGWNEFVFTGDVIELEILLHRFNGDRGLDDFGELLKLIEE